MTHLILHKVRGEPAFDVASQMEVEGEVWWIIPTSGHRAYPAKVWALETLLEISEDLPEDLPDHYNVTREPESRKAKGKIDLGALLSNLAPKLKRRF